MIVTSAPFHGSKPNWTAEAQLDSRETESLPPPDIMFALNTFKIGSNLAFMPPYATIPELFALRREAYPVHIRGGGGAGTHAGSKRGGDNDGASVDNLVGVPVNKRVGVPVAGVRVGHLPPRASMPTR